MMLNRSNHMPIRTRIETTYSTTGLVRAFFQNKISGDTQLQKYIVQSAHAYDFVTFQNSDALSNSSPL